MKQPRDEGKAEPPSLDPQRLVLLEFPTLEAAHAWYHSAEYQRLKAVRTENSQGQIVVTAGLDA